MERGVGSEHSALSTQYAVVLHRSPLHTSSTQASPSPSPAHPTTPQPPHPHTTSPSPPLRQIDRSACEFPATNPWRHGRPERFLYLMANDREGQRLPFRDLVKCDLESPAGNYFYE